MLAEALAPLDRSTETVLTREDGQPYNPASLHTMMWKVWLPAAGIARPKAKNERGYSLHGLRKALGGKLVDAGATTFQSRDVLGHRTLTEVERYARSRDQAKAATEGMRKVVRLVRGEA